MHGRAVLLLLFCLGGLTALLPANALAGNVKIVANLGVNAETISPGEIRSVFLAEQGFLHGAHIEPVFLKGGPAHEAFLRQYLEKSDNSLQSYYRSLVFTGRGVMPRVLESDDEVVAYVAKTRGAIGYVSSTAAIDGVKTLVVRQPESDDARALIIRVEPVYPDVLWNNHIGGTVRIKVTIAASGAVEGVEQIGGDSALGEAAMAAVRKWVYSAGRSRTQIEVSILFNPNR